MTEAALQEGPVHIPRQYPNILDDAIDNLLAFSVPRENAEQSLGDGSTGVVLSHQPPFPKCYGWLDFDGKLINRLPITERPLPLKRNHPPRDMDTTHTYHAIVYEYIPEEENKPELVRAALWYLFYIGFSCSGSPRIENWKGGRLIDFSDFIFPGGVAWTSYRYGSASTERSLLPDSGEEELAKWDVNRNPRSMYRRGGG